MKWLFFSDFHSHNFEQFSYKTPDGRNSRFAKALDVIEQMTTYCCDNDVSTVVFLGDLHDCRKYLDIDVLSCTYDAISRLRKSVDHMLMLVGNHDQNTRVGEIHSLEHYRDIATVISKPVVMTLEGVQFAAHPHTPYTEDIVNFCKDYATGGKFFFFHQGLREGKLGFYETMIKTEIGIEDLPYKKYDYCIGGDYHKPQVLGPKNNILYCGSPLQLSMNERGDKKGWWIWDSDTDHLTMIESKAPEFHYFNTAAEFWEFCARPGTNPEEDYVRVITNQKDSEDIKRRYPNVQLEITSSTPVQTSVRIEPASIKQDSLLIREYIKIKTGEASQYNRSTLEEIATSVLEDKA